MRLLIRQRAQLMGRWVTIKSTETCSSIARSRRRGVFRPAHFSATPVDSKSQTSPSYLAWVDRLSFGFLGLCAGKQSCKVERWMNLCNVARPSRWGNLRNFLHPFFCAGTSGVRTAESEVWLHKRSGTSWQLCNRLSNFPVNYFHSLKSSEANWFEKWWEIAGFDPLRGVEDGNWIRVHDGSINQSSQVIDVYATSKTLHWPPRILCCPMTLNIASIYCLLSGNTDLLDPYAFLPIGILHCSKLFPTVW